VIDAHGAPKQAWYALKHALAPIAMSITDEGSNGLVIHVVNDRSEPLAGQLDVTLYHGGEVQVGHAAIEIRVPAHAATELAAASLFDGFLDLSFAFRFGPPTADFVHAVLGASDTDGRRTLARASWFPAGIPTTCEPDVGLTVTPRPGERSIVIATKRFAQTVTIDPRCSPRDNYFHMPPGTTRQVTLDGALRGTVTALNSEVSARFEVGA
jgi:beta-mannosidase